MTVGRGRVASIVVLLAASIPGAARADDTADTTYGRVEGDVAFAGALGATFGPRGPRATVDARARYLQTAGVFTTYEDGALFASAAEPRRALTAGLEARPLFLARWLRGWELGVPVVDLAIDSLGLELGVTFAEPEGRPFGSRPALSLGVGLEVPLLGRASGLFLGVRGGGRFSEAALAGTPGLGPADRAGFLAITLGWQALVGTGLVSAGGGRR